MRCVIRRLTLLAAALMLFALPVLADEGASDKALEQGQQSGKDECLLLARNCGNEVDSIQQRIDRIKNEIGRGANVYNDDELKTLNNRLENEIRVYEELNMGG